MSTNNNHQTGGAINPADHRNRATRRAKARGQTLADKRQASEWHRRVEHFLTTGEVVREVARPMSDYEF